MDEKSNVQFVGPGSDAKTVATPTDNLKYTNANNEQDIPDTLCDKNPVLWPQILGAVSGALVHFAVACILGFTGVTLPSLMNPESEDIILDKFQASIFSSILFIGAMVGSVLSSLMMTWLGQRSTLLVCLPVGVLSWFVLAFGRWFWLLALARLVQGVVLGVSAGCANNYVVEIAHKNIRGRLMGMIDLLRQIGFLFVYAVGSSQLSWRNVCLVAGVISMSLPLMGMIFLPHSPRWLAIQGRKLEAINSLKFFRGANYDVYSELNDIEAQQEMSSPKANSLTKKGPDVRDQLKLLTKRSVLIRFAILAILMFCCHFTGISILSIYSVSVFESAETEVNPYLSTIIVAVARILAALAYLAMADKLGRRPLLMVPLFISGLAMLGFGTFFYFKESTKHISSIKWLPLILMIVYAICSSIYLPVLMVLRSELLPNSVRSVGVGLLYLVFFSSSFVVSVSYPYMVDSLGSDWTFWMYGATSFVIFFIVAIAIPETKGKSLEEIEEMFSRN